jgi:hypothetical protein
MPNIENFKKVRDLIANAPETRFNMADYVLGRMLPDGYHVCGTAMCIAGWAYIAKTEAQPMSNGTYKVAYPVGSSYCEQATEYLDIDDDEANYIFGGEFAQIDRIRFLAEITKQQALDYLDKVIATGDVYVGNPDYSI